MQQSHFDVRSLAFLSIYAALIFVSIQFFRIPLGAQFVHLGNALVVIAFLLFGLYQGFLAAAVGLAVFDLLNGYAAEIPVILLEAAAVGLVVYLVYDRLFQEKDQPLQILTVAVGAALIKILLNLVRYALINILAANLPLDQALLASIDKIAGTFGSAAVTVIAVPILYPILKRGLQTFRLPFRTK
ncbi:ECF transporter S component [Streptococcus panodentis]|uniref:Integral membrane protein n=1 Tax=Streptococcus panodentis TaxID=1581472 RepID=A0ABS5B036_9STRE|nr:ECF transporter S component [Streptococcus panodentis]MBP2622201.1 hypothetical protein [Streptococcus panodentis]